MLNVCLPFRPAAWATEEDLALTYFRSGSAACRFLQLIERTVTILGRCAGNLQEGYFMQRLVPGLKHSCPFEL